MMPIRTGAMAAAISLASLFAVPSAGAQEFIISTGLGQSHLWTKDYMDPFAEAIESETDVNFTRFYAGELTTVGRGLDGLVNGTIQVAAPLLAPYHEGRFPLSDITQLPIYGSDSPMVTRAFQKLLDSDVELQDGKTFYDYEIASKGIRAWAVGATAPYSISTAEKVLEEPADFKGLPLRAGSAIHTIVLNELGSTPVTIPGVEAYEAMSRGTIDGIIIAISDWPTYSLQQLIRHSIVDVSIGHWESYLAISESAWEQLADEEKETWNETARELALKNAQAWEDNVETVKRKSIEEDGGDFVSIDDLSPAMQDHIAEAAADTWITWIEQTEANGHPAKAAAKLYAQIIVEEGGELPEGIAEYLGL